MSLDRTARSVPELDAPEPVAIVLPFHCVTLLLPPPPPPPPPPEPVGRPEPPETLMERFPDGEMQAMVEAPLGTVKATQELAWITSLEEVAATPLAP